MRKFFIALLLSIAAMFPIATQAGSIGAGLGEALQNFGERMLKREQEQELIRYKYEMEMQAEARQEARRIEAEKRQWEAENKQREAEKQKTERDRREKEAKAIYTGSGFFVTTDGYIITNYHVVEDKTYYAVRDINSRFYRAKVVARDTKEDLALLKIDGTFPALKVGKSDSVTKGQRILAVGYPQISIQGNESKVTDGIISSFSGIKDNPKWFQISAPVQGGNSGGPLVTESGLVVGVVVATVSAAKFHLIAGNFPQNVNYAIKSNVVLDFLAEYQIKNNPRVNGKTSVSAVDNATVLIIARREPIDVGYYVSPQDIAREKANQARQAAEEARRIKAAEKEEKRQAALLAVEEARRGKEEKLAEKGRKTETFTASNPERNGAKLQVENTQEQIPGSKDKPPFRQVGQVSEVFQDLAYFVFNISDPYGVNAGSRLTVVNDRQQRVNVRVEKVSGNKASAAPMNLNEMSSIMINGKVGVE